MPTDRIRWMLAITAMAMGSIALAGLVLAGGYHNHDELVLLDRQAELAEILRELGDALLRADGTFYRPLGNALFQLQLRLHDLGPGAVHAASVLHHAANAALFAWVLARHGAAPRPALWLLMLPVALPGVGWVAPVYDRMLLTWLLLAVGLLRSPGRAAAAAILTIFLLALATKDSAVVLPVVAVLLWRTAPPATRCSRLVPIALIGLGSAYLGWRWLNASTPAVEYRPQFDTGLLVRALRYAAFPFAVTAEDPRTVWGLRWLLGGAGAAAMLASAFWPPAQRRPALLALTLTVLPLLPVLPVGMTTGHYVYLSAPGFALLLDLALRGGGRAAWCLLPWLALHSLLLSWHGHRLAVALTNLQLAHRALVPSASAEFALVAAPGAVEAVLPRFSYYVRAQGLRPALAPEPIRPRLVLQADGSVVTER